MYEVLLIDCMPTQKKKNQPSQCFYKEGIKSYEYQKIKLKQRS